MNYIKMLTLAAVVIIFVLEIVVLLRVPFSTIFSCFQIAIRFSKIQICLLLFTIGVREDKKETPKLGTIVTSSDLIMIEDLFISGGQKPFII